MVGSQALRPSLAVQKESFTNYYSNILSNSSEAEALPMPMRRHYDDLRPTTTLSRTTIDLNSHQRQLPRMFRQVVEATISSPQHTFLLHGMVHAVVNLLFASIDLLYVGIQVRICTTVRYDCMWLLSDVTPEINTNDGQCEIKSY